MIAFKSVTRLNRRSMFLKLYLVPIRKFTEPLLDFKFNTSPSKLSGAPPTTKTPTLNSKRISPKVNDYLLSIKIEIHGNRITYINIKPSLTSTQLNYELSVLSNSEQIRDLLENSAFHNHLVIIALIRKCAERNLTLLKHEKFLNAIIKFVVNDAKDPTKHVNTSAISNHILDGSKVIQSVEYFNALLTLLERTDPKLCTDTQMSKILSGLSQWMRGGLIDGATTLKALSIVTKVLKGFSNEWTSALSISVALNSVGYFVSSNDECNINTSKLLKLLFKSIEIGIQKNKIRLAARSLLNTPTTQSETTSLIMNEFQLSQAIYGTRNIIGEDRKLAVRVIVSLLRDSLGYVLTNSEDSLMAKNLFNGEGFPLALRGVCKYAKSPESAEMIDVWCTAIESSPSINRMVNMIDLKMLAQTIPEFRNPLDDVSLRILRLVNQYLINSRNLRLSPNLISYLGGSLRYLTEKTEEELKYKANVLEMLHQAKLTRSEVAIFCRGYYQHNWTTSDLDIRAIKLLCQTLKLSLIVENNDFNDPVKNSTDFVRILRAVWRFKASPENYLCLEAISDYLNKIYNNNSTILSKSIIVNAELAMKNIPNDSPEGTRFRSLVNQIISNSR